TAQAIQEEHQKAFYSNIEQETAQTIQEEHQKASYSKPQEALQQEKTETTIEESERTINDSQMSVIRNVFKNDLSEKALAKLHTLTFRQGAAVLSLLQQKKKEEALKLLREWLEDQDKDQDNKNSDKNPPILAEKPKVEKEEPAKDVVKTTTTQPKTQERNQKDTKMGLLGSSDTNTFNLDELKKLDDKSLINLLRQHQVDIKELFNDESILPDTELDI
ncbi:MAG: hypothetical protein QXX12_04590, partial [Nanopusillaceae archaeon]